MGKTNIHQLANQSSRQLSTLLLVKTLYLKQSQTVMLLIIYNFGH